jgi:hypothetical protein
MNSVTNIIGNVFEITTTSKRIIVESNFEIMFASYDLDRLNITYIQNTLLRDNDKSLYIYIVFPKKDVCLSQLVDELKKFILNQLKLKLN